MFCTDVSENSNCHKISLGGFVAGTILKMPPGCGPSRYTVAGSMLPAANQTLPKYITKRDYGHRPTVYDLKFDYEWHRVRRDVGETQMRVDFSNEVVSLDSPIIIYTSLLEPNSATILPSPSRSLTDQHVVGVLGQYRCESRVEKA